MSIMPNELSSINKLLLYGEGEGKGLATMKTSVGRGKEEVYL